MPQSRVTTAPLGFRLTPRRAVRRIRRSLRLLSSLPRAVRYTLGIIVPLIIGGAGLHVLKNPRLQLEGAYVYTQGVLFDSLGTRYNESRFIDFDRNCTMTMLILGSNGPRVWSEHVGATIDWYLGIRNRGWEPASNVRIGLVLIPSSGPISFVGDPRAESNISATDSIGANSDARVIAITSPIPMRERRILVFRQRLDSASFHDLVTGGAKMRVTFLSSTEGGDEINPPLEGSATLQVENNTVRFSDRSSRLEVSVTEFAQSDSGAYARLAAEYPQWLRRFTYPPCPKALK